MSPLEDESFGGFRWGRSSHTDKVGRYRTSLASGDKISKLYSQVSPVVTKQAIPFHLILLGNRYYRAALWAYHKDCR